MAVPREWQTLSGDWIIEDGVKARERSQLQGTWVNEEATPAPAGGSPAGSLMMMGVGI